MSNEKIRMIGTRTLLLPVLDTVELIHARPEVGWVTTECNLQRCKELVHARQKGLWRCCRGCDSWLTLKYYDTIGEVCRHDEVVLDDERGFLRVQNESV